MMKTVLLSFFVLLASGCATRAVQSLADLPLPAAPGAGCCWQAVQQLHIRYDGQDYHLTGALARTTTGVTLVLLDPVGRRLLSINKQGDTLDIYRSPELPAQLPERFLLASSMLVWWSLADWQALLVADPHWQVTVDAHSRLLSYRGRPLVRATYPSPVLIREGMSASVTSEPAVILQHQHQALMIHIATESREPL